MFSLVVAFRGRGWRWPFRESDELEVWSGTQECVGRIPAALLVQLVVHYLQGAALQESVRRALATQGAPALPGPAPLAKKPLKAVNGRRLRGYDMPRKADSAL
jgi:hypothetical protein